MGLLGDGWDDPKSMATLQLAAGLLGPGGFGTGLSRGLLGYQGAMTNDADLKLKQQQIENTKQEAALRDLNVQKAMAQLREAQAWDQPRAPSPGMPHPSIMAGAPGTTPQPGSPTMGAPGSAGAGGAPSSLPPGIAGYKGMPLEQLRARMNAGFEPKEAAELWKMANFGQQMQPGYRQNADGTTTYFGDPTKGVDLKNGVVTPMPGAADTLGALAGATKAGELDATNKRTPIPLDRLDRSPGVNPFGSLYDFLQQGKPAAAAPAGGAPFSGLTPATQRDVLYNMGKYGVGTVNGKPIDAAAPAAPAEPPATFKSAADLEAEKLKATQGVHLDTDPLIQLRKDVLTKAHEANQASFSNLAEIVNNEGEIVARNTRLQPLLDQIPNVGGFGSDARVEFANKLKTSGFPGVSQETLNKLSAKLAGGDPDAAKVVANQLSAAAIQTMLDTLNKEGKPNRAMFEALHREQEGLAAGKNVLAGVMALQNELYQQHQQQLGTMTDLMASPDYHPVKFQSQFASAKNAQIQPGTDLPANPNASNLTKGTVYKLPNGKTGVWDGMKFKGQP